VWTGKIGKFEGEVFMRRSRFGILTFFVVALFGTGCERDVTAIVANFLNDSTEAKSCILLDEGCGTSEALFSPKLDPNCGLTNTGEVVDLTGTYAAQLNMLSQTYIPFPIDAWKPAASTQYGYVVIEDNPDNPGNSLVLHRRYCMYYNTKVMGSKTIYYTKLFYNLKTFDYQVDSVAPDGFLIGDPFMMLDGWTTWGLTEDFDPWTMDSPKTSDSEYVIDEDLDGKPGVHITVDSPISIVSGEFHILQSCYFDEELKICSANQLQGYRTNASPTDQITLSTTALTGNSNIIAETKEGSTVMYVRLSHSTEMPDQPTICERIMADKATLFGGEGTGELYEEGLEDDEEIADDAEDDDDGEVTE
jgi:hypothetical protein